jgi:hypothetical protein
MPKNIIKQADKVLVSFYKLIMQSGEKKFALEDVAVAVWKDDPDEFCMRGYKEHPDVERIRRVISNLISRGYVNGNVGSYKITDRGMEIAKMIKEGKKGGGKIKSVESAGTSRRLQREIDRLLSSKIILDYVAAKAKGEKLDLLESDFFQFLGTTPRAIYDDNGKPFKDRYEIITKELIPFCKKSGKEDKKAILIIEVWQALEKKFNDKINKWLNGTREKLEKRGSQESHLKNSTKF